MNRRHAEHEVEIKLPVPDLGAMRGRLTAMGARAGPRLYEGNVLFDTRNQTLRRRAVLLRLRAERPAGAGVPGAGGSGRRDAVEEWVTAAEQGRKRLVTLKTPPRLQLSAAVSTRRAKRTPTAQYKILREVEFTVSDSAALRAMLLVLGFGPSFVYEKFRTTYSLPRHPALLIQLDETPVGSFLELEGPRRAIDRVRRALGYARADVVLANYGTLYTAWCVSRKIVPHDMLFA